MIFTTKTHVPSFLLRFNNTVLNVSQRNIKKSNLTNRSSNLHNLSNNSIIISQSRDIYENLALEDWLYKKYDFTSKNICLLLMWYNSPAVVIGRHQNPWIECSLDFCLAAGVSIARRNSGGGTVYHDDGNLNCSFFTPRKKYNRKANLNFICSSLQKKWPLNLSVSQRDDILLHEKFKISGTASKLGRNNAYHHCTVLVNVDEVKLHQALHRELNGIDSKATSSIKSEVKNLKAVCPEISITSVIKSLNDEYRLIYEVKDENVFSIHPLDVCSSLNTVTNQLKSWDWCFGKTPRFTAVKSFPLCPSFSKWEVKNLPQNIEIKLSINRGVIESITLSPPVLDKCSLEILNDHTIGLPFSSSIKMDNWVEISNNRVLVDFLKSCILQIIFDVHR